VANKAFAASASRSTPPSILGVQLLRSYATGTFLATGNYAYVLVDYADSSYDTWSKVVAQVRSDMSDSSLIVINAPSSFDSLVYRNTY